MNKVKILGVEKSPTHNVFTFAKEQGFIKGFREMLKDLDWENHPKAVWFGMKKDEGAMEPSKEEQDISGMVDEIHHIEREGLRADLVLGKDKIFLIFTSKADKQEKLTEAVLKFASF